jgi:hypothetical protein
VKSILHKEKECFVCNKKTGLHLHHIYYGKNRNISDKNGFVCYLCFEHHEGTDGVHGKNGNDLNLYLKQICQKTYEMEHSREEFIRLMGKSYL